MAGGCGKGVGGPAADFGCWAQNKNGPERRGREKDKRKGFSILKSNQPKEFKHKFEFKHSKTMHQHVCNIKLL
jgi:hypothetical protein